MRQVISVPILLAENKVALPTTEAPREANSRAYCRPRPTESVPQNEKWTFSQPTGMDEGGKNGGVQSGNGHV